jgi:hypothetical protein
MSAGIAFVVHKAFLSNQWSLLTAALLLTALTPPYAWALHKAFLYGSGDAKAAKRRTLIAIAVSAAVIAVVLILPAVLSGLGFGLGGGNSDDDSDSSDDSGPGWNFGGFMSDGYQGSGRYASPGEAPHYAGAELRAGAQGGMCGGCGRYMASSFYGLCAACSMPRY